MDLKDVENLAELARIELSEQEKKELLSDMQSILEYVKIIESVEVENVPARNAFSIADAGGEPEYKIYNVWREDLPTVASEVSFSHKLIVEQFPDAKDDFLKVKKILQ